MLDANQLASLRSVFAATFLDLTCTIQRIPTPYVNTAQGHRTDAYAPKYTGVACKLATPDANDLDAFAGRIGSRQAWTVRFTQGTDVLVNDRLVVAGMTLQVEAVISPKSWEILLSVLASQVRV